MKTKMPYYALLAGFLLAACSPIDLTPDSSGTKGELSALKTIPEKFHGTWTLNKDGKHPAEGEGPLVIVATFWENHESSGQLKSIRFRSANDITVTMTVTGEGDTWEDETRMRLSPDGKVLTLSSHQHEWTRYRVRQ